MQNLIAWFVQRPLLVNLIMVLVFVLGWLTLADMRYEYNPHVELGNVTITTVRAGAGPEEVELSITLPLEEELLEVEGIKKLYSNSMENLSVISLELDLDAADKQQIMREVQSAVDRAEARLPADLVEKPLIDELSTLTTPVMEVHVTGNVSEGLLREVARQTADGLREVDGVASVEKIGYRRPEVKILLAADKLARLGISHEEIIAAIQSRNIRDSGGAIDSFLTEKKVVAVGQFRQPKDVESVVIRSREPGNTVLLRDIARVVEGFEDWEVQSRIDGQMSVALNVRKTALADENFLRGVARLTNVRVMSKPKVLRFDDDEIFDYPFLYALEMGRNGGLSLSTRETENLREYLLRGGFLLIDDFWGMRQWDVFYRDFSQIFPDRQLVELYSDHEIFHTFYDIDGAQMIPGRGGRRGSGQAGIDSASNHAILDDDGRVMVLVNWNSDMGDGWEHTFDRWYPTQYANSAYQLGINYLIYSLTH